MSAVLQTAVTYRPVQFSDLKQILEIERAAYSHPWTPGIFLDCLKSDYHCWLSESDADILAYAVMMVAAGEAHLLNLCVHPARQRNGLGRDMLNHLLRLAPRYGANAVFLEVRASNQAAWRLYSREGFNEVGLRRNYYPLPQGREDAIIMARELTRD